MYTLSRLIPRLFLAGLLSLAAATAYAQTYVAPLIGANIGGDAGCAAAGCESPSVTLGAQYGYFENVFGYEEDFGYIINLFRDGPGARSRVITLMSNITYGPLIKDLWRPYVVGGVGFLKSKVEVSPSRQLAVEYTGFGWDLGGGVVIAKPRGTLGLKADWRMYRGFNDLRVEGFPVTDTHLFFTRLSLGVLIQFQ